MMTTANPGREETRPATNLTSPRESTAPDTTLGPVHLSVTDGDRALQFWRDTLGLSLLSADRCTIRLGAGAHELVVLYPGADRPVVPHTTGLYQVAILLPSRREPARVIGFDEQGLVPRMGMVSAGGYHYHIGLNTWAGRGGPEARV